MIHRLLWSTPLSSYNRDFFAGEGLAWKTTAHRSASTGTLQCVEQEKVCSILITPFDPA